MEAKDGSTTKTYYDVLDLAHAIMNYEPFIKLVSELVIESEKLWL